MDNSQHPLLNILNDQQRAAVVATDGPALVLAGPGSGKTRVLTHRIAWMLQEMQVQPWHIMAVTFTNKAAREMRHRLETMLGDSSARSMTMGTFHGTCARILRREAEHIGRSNSYLIFDSDDQQSLMKQVVADMGLDNKRYKPRAILNAVSAAKNELILPADYPTHTYYDEVVSRLYVKYQEALARNDALDFDDLLMATAQLFRENPFVLEHYRDRFQYMLVDEFQDTNMAQYVMLKALAQEHRHIFVVADEDQSIYSWRGADYRNISRLRTDFPEVQEYLLEENYRSTQVVLDAARAVINRNSDRTPKHLFTSKAGGAPVSLRECYDEREEAEFVATEIRKLIPTYGAGGMAVMYRTNAQSRAIEEALVNYNIPYRLIGGTRFYSRKEIKDILAFLRLVQNPDDDVSFLRVINVPTRGIGARTIDKISTEAQRLDVGRYEGLLSLLREKKVTGRTQAALNGFVTMYEQWALQREELSVEALIDRIILDTDYEMHIRDGSDQGESRWENILALRGVVTDAPDITLLNFLTEVALVADVDELEEETEAVTLLTLHAAKGLEFPAVFLIGLEEGMLPHSRSMESPMEVAEERRLFYVGMTRAEQRLYLTYAFRRSWGYYNNSSQPSSPSRFLADLPDEVLAVPRKRKQQRSTASNSWAVSSWQQPATSTPKPTPPPRKELTYRSGQRVRHSHYGEGMVIESSISGRNEMVTILFSNGAGIKKFMAGMAPIEVISEH